MELSDRRIRNGMKKKKNQSPSECNKLSFRGLWEIKGLVLNSSRERKEGEGRIPGEDDTRTMTDKK